MLEPFELPYVQDGLVAVLLLSVVAGLLGSYVVLRGLAFYVHAVGTAAFPGLVLADGLGFAAALGGFGAALGFAAASVAIGRARRTSADSATALVLVACLAAGVILASDVFGSGANVETLLFGSLLLIDGGDLRLAAGAALLAVLAAAVAGPRWLARGFDPASAPALGAASARLEAVLLASLALAATAALAAVGALLVTAILVVPAATVRLVTKRLRALQIGSTALAAAEGVLGVWLSVKTDAPPGATIAVLSGSVFLVVAVARVAAARRSALLAAPAAALALAGCGGSEDAGSGVGVVATTPQVADLVRSVAGDGFDVDVVIEPGTDPHDYEPRPSDVAATADAAIVFRSGGDLDEWAEDLVADSGSDARVVSLDRSLPVRLPGEGDETDPHWWHDPRNAVAAVAEIEAALARTRPGARETVRRRAAAYAERLRRLDRAIAGCVAAIPPARRKLVTDHDALSYYANRYGFEIVGSVIPALTTEAQPSSGEIADLADLVEREGVPAIFPEASVPADLAEALATDSGADVGGELYSDSLGEEGTPAGTYAGMLEANTDAIVRGLTEGRRGCEAEAGGR